MGDGQSEIMVGMYCVIPFLMTAAGAVTGGLWGSAWGLPGVFGGVVGGAIMGFVFGQTSLFLSELDRRVSRRNRRLGVLVCISGLVFSLGVFIAMMLLSARKMVELMR